MRILHVISGLEWGSAERQLEMLLSELGTPWDQRVILLHGAAPSELPQQDRITSLQLPRHTTLAAARNLRSAVQDARPDILHAWRVGACCWTSLSCRSLPSRRMASLWQWASPADWSARFVEQACRRWFDCCVTPSWLESDARFTSSACHSIGYGIRPSAGEPAKRAARAALQLKYQIPRDIPLVGFLGPWRRESRLHDVIWAADLLKVLRDDVHVVIAGYGPMAGRLFRFRKQVQITDRVHFVQRAEDFEHALQGLDCLWASAQTALGVPVLLEAMARGIPVVATNVPPHLRYVTPESSGLLVNVGHRAGFAKQTLRLLEDPKFAKQLGDAAQRAVTLRCATAPVVQQYRQLYSELSSQ